jgi:NADH:ubiquinone oxidoreductase subunit E
VLQKYESHPEPNQEQGLGQEQLAAIDAVIRRYRGKPGGLIPVLEEIQESLGYLPKSVQRKVARDLRIPLGEVYGVVTFYSFFTMVPKGRHTVRVCLGTACYVGGGEGIMSRLSEILGVRAGDTTPDKRFTLEEVRCLGACGLAPVLLVNEDTFRQVKPTKIPGILKQYE